MLKSLLVVIVLLSVSAVHSQTPLKSWPKHLDRSAGVQGAEHVGFSKLRPDRFVPERPGLLKGPTPQSLVWDATIGSSKNAPGGGMVYAMASEGDDLYVAGDFYDFDSLGFVSNLVHNNKATGVWDAVDVGTTNTIRAVAVHNGKVFIGGYFHYAGLQAVENIAMWDGTKWSDLSGGMDGSVYCLAFVGDDLYAGGYFTQAGSTAVHNLAKWNGTSWEDVGGGTSYPVLSMCAVHDSLFIGGSFTWVGGQSASTGIVADGIALWHNGWTTFDDGFSGTVDAIAMHQGKLWAGGDFYYTRDGSRIMNGLASWDGETWQTAASDDFTGSVYALYSTDSELYASGQFDDLGGIVSHGLMVLKDGAWSEVGGGIHGYGAALAVFGNELYVGGNFDKVGPTAAQSIAAFSLSTKSWRALGDGAANGWGSELIIAVNAANDKIYVGGNFTSMAGKPASHVAVYDRLARRWSSMGEGVDGDVRCIRAVGDKVYVGGWFHHAGSVRVRNLAVWDASTSTWSAMGAGAKVNVSAIASDGKNVYVENTMEETPSAYTVHIGKWDGSQWTELPGDLNAYFGTLRWSDGKLYGGGDIRQIDGVDYNNIAMFDGQNWQSFGNGLDDFCDDIAVVGKDIYATGLFLTADDLDAPGIARWDGSTWNSLGTGLNYPGYALEPDGKGGIYVTGSFTEADGIPAGELAQWDGTTFTEVNGGLDNDGVGLASDPNALYVAGWFTSVGASPTTSEHIAELRGAGRGVTQSVDGAFEFTLLASPARSEFQCKLQVARAQRVAVVVTDLLGRVLISMPAAPYSTGEHVLRFSTSGFTSGTYAVHLTAEDGHSVTSFVSLVK